MSYLRDNWPDLLILITALLLIGACVYVITR